MAHHTSLNLKKVVNFGDCFAYALARARGEPLLFKGDDSAAPMLRLHCNRCRGAMR